jgi:hypothetical protein
MPCAGGPCAGGPRPRDRPSPTSHVTGTVTQDQAASASGPGIAPACAAGAAVRAAGPGRLILRLTQPGRRPSRGHRAYGDCQWLGHAETSRRRDPGRTAGGRRDRAASLARSENRRDLNFNFLAVPAWARGRDPA